MLTTLATRSARKIGAQATETQDQCQPSACRHPRGGHSTQYHGQHRERERHCGDRAYPGHARSVDLDRQRASVLARSRSCGHLRRVFQVSADAPRVTSSTRWEGADMRPERSCGTHSSKGLIMTVTGTKITTSATETKITTARDPAYQRH
jgi:hypothetical protein